MRVRVCVCVVCVSCVCRVFLQMLLEDSWDQYVLVRTLLRLEMSGDDGRAVRRVFEAVMSFYAQMGKVQNLLLVVIFDELNLAAPSSSAPADPGAEQQAAVLFREDSVGLRMLTTFLNQEVPLALPFFECLSICVYILDNVILDNVNISI